MITRPIAAIIGVGAAAPSRVVTNADLEKTLDTSDAWITERTGIRQRHIAERFETLTSYSLVAAQQALAMAGLTAADLDGIVFATVSPDHRLPSAACDLQAALGIEGCWAVDVVAAETHAARVGLHQAGEQLRGGGFARAVRPEEAIQLAGADGEVQTVERPEVAVVHGEVFDLDHA